jgi:3-methyladenine DNA glycosylase AlkD
VGRGALEDRGKIDALDFLNPRPGVRALRPPGSGWSAVHMEYNEVMRELEAMGTAQNRKIYGRHGVRGDMFGVSYANLGKLKKKIKVDHDLAVALWASGNHDARVLATMVADPEMVTARDLDTWVKELDNYVLTDAFSGLAGKSAAGRKKINRWIKSRSEWIKSAGWNLVGGMALHSEDVDDAVLETYLKTIESGIHTAPNRVRHSMNMALISIGMRNAALEKKAVAAAGRIGKVEVDHGETSCKTPDAAAYIKKVRARRR